MFVMAGQVLRARPKLEGPTLAEDLGLLRTGPDLVEPSV